MRLVMQGLSAVAAEKLLISDLIDIGCNIVETLCAKEKAVPRTVRPAHKAHIAVQRGMRLLGGKAEIARAASALNPMPTATASISVDLPTPFSPTRMVTGAVNASGCSAKWRTTGRPDR